MEGKIKTLAKYREVPKIKELSGKNLVLKSRSLRAVPAGPLLEVRELGPRPTVRPEPPTHHRQASQGVAWYLPRGQNCKVLY